MFNLVPLRKWSDKVVKDIEDAELRDYARIGFNLLNYILMFALIGASVSVVGKITGMVVEVAKALATTPN